MLNSSVFRELADLLGQVKPPTASKEEIANSGLEIIKPAQLAEHEKNGKIASNCVDRVRTRSSNYHLVKLMIFCSA